MNVFKSLISSFNLVCLFRKRRMVDKKIYIIQGEVGTVVGAIKRNSRWNTHTPLVRFITSVAFDLLGSPSSSVFPGAHLSNGTVRCEVSTMGLVVWPDRTGKESELAWLQSGGCQSILGWGPVPL